MKKSSLIIIIAVALVLALISSAIIIIYGNIKNNLDDLYDVEFSNINMSVIEDGTYFGSYEYFPISVEVNVTVTNHNITKIDILKHSNGKGASGEAITDSVIAEQSLEVDAITGATYSSKVILLAIENALLNANN